MDGRRRTRTTIALALAVGCALGALPMLLAASGAMAVAPGRLGRWNVARGTPVAPMLPFVRHSYAIDQTTGLRTVMVSVGL